MQIANFYGLKNGSSFVFSVEFFNELISTLVDPSFP